jgi:hypothetical protein
MYKQQHAKGKTILLLPQLKLSQYFLLIGGGGGEQTVKKFNLCNAKIFMLLKALNKILLLKVTFSNAKEFV